MQKTIGLLAMLCGGMLVAAGCNNPNMGDTFKAKLTGGAEMPPVKTQASGTATFTFDKNATTLHYVVNVSGALNLVGAHIHLAPQGQSGPPVAMIWEGTKPGRFSGTLAEGTLTQSDLRGLMEGQTIADLKEKMKLGRLYVNVHTERSPDGELRGQIR